MQHLKEEQDRLVPVKLNRQFDPLMKLLNDLIQNIFWTKKSRDDEKLVPVRVYRFHRNELNNNMKINSYE